MNDTPAALDTLITHFRDTGRKPSYYDLIITGEVTSAEERQNSFTNMMTIALKTAVQL